MGAIAATFWILEQYCDAAVADWDILLILRVLLQRVQ